MIENGMVFKFDKTQKFEHGKCVADVLCSSVCYICRTVGCPHCHIAPREGEKLGFIRVDGRLISNVSIDRCTLMSDEANVVFDVLMEITTHGKKRRLLASELVGYAWYTEE